MKAWCVPVNFPHPKKEPEQAEAARKFIGKLKGLHGVTMHGDGIMLLAFLRKEDARQAKWKLEEFCPVRLDIIEGTITDDNAELRLNRVLKGE